MAPHDSITELFKQAEDFLAGNRRLIEDGKDVDMAAFDHGIRELCSHVANLPIEEARKYQQPLEKMAAALGELSAALAARRDELKSQLHGLNTQSQAQAAYRKTSGLGDEPPGE